ncbi:MAG: hypothetical protein LVQ64_00910 [Thermoplasmatales archaeon]|nr:hypothetical protein [Thermoplasmatales archaeon]
MGILCREAWYVRNYPPDMFVELDAFFALATAEARNLIRAEVEALFDGRVHARTRKEEVTMRQAIDAAVEERVTFEEDT